VATGTLVRTLAGHSAAVSCVTFSADGTRIASVSDDDTIKLWETATGQELLTLKGHTPGLLGVAFSPDGGWLASANRDNAIILWDGRPWGK
jgi:WD40 repeat protein